MNKKEKRLKILQDDEIGEMFGIPKFTPEDQLHFFSLNETEAEIVSSLGSSRSKIHFILLLGYFRTKKIFFTLNSQHLLNDIRFINSYHSISSKDFISIGVSKPTRQTHQKIILKLYEYKLFEDEEKEKTRVKASKAVIIDSTPRYIFQELLHYLESNKIVKPGYSTLQDIVSNTISDEKKRLESLLNKHLSKEIKASVDKLLSIDNKLYEITYLKKEPKNFKLNQIAEELNKRKTLQPIYEFANSFLPKLHISNENIKYYASLVDFYSVFRLKRIEPQLIMMYLLCFAFHKFQKINDNLINAFIYKVSNYSEAGKTFSKEEVSKQRIEANNDLDKAGSALGLYIDDSVSDDMLRKKAFTILPRNKFKKVIAFIKKIKIDEKAYEWEYHNKKALTYRMNLRELLININFESKTENDSLMKAVNFLRETINPDKPFSKIELEKFPLEAIPTKLKRYIYETKKMKIGKRTIKRKIINPDRYEFLVYHLLHKNIDSDNIFVRDSVNFKRLEDELVSIEVWENNKERLINELNLPVLNTPIEEQLAEFKKELESKIITVNKRIASGENKHIKITKTKCILPYENIETVNNPFYTQFSRINVSDVLRFVDRQCGFTETFTHILNRYSKTDKDNDTVIASITAQGTNIGLLRMSEISDMDYQELISTSNNFIRLETLREANDEVSNATAALSIFKDYNIKEGTIHSGIDGQKRETGIDTINSRHSPKYFGLAKGIVPYTMLANHVPINLKLIGANEYEGHHLFDLVYNNTSDIIPDIHSTDTHGTNAINFALLHIFGYKFAPRYRNLFGRKHILYGFKHPSEYHDCLIKPSRKIKEDIIIAEWKETIRWIIVSLANKNTTQSIIVRKLCASGGANKTKQALWEYNNILMSLHNLEYIDDISFRQSIQKALCRSEAYNRLFNAIPYADGGKYRVKSEGEQKILIECTRLIANCIIYYNAHILDKLLTEAIKEGNTYEADIIKRISPVAWQHINLYGRYEFRNNPADINVDNIVASLKIKKEFLD